MDELRKKPGRPRLPPEQRMEVLSINISPDMRRTLDVLSMRCDKSLATLAREALDLLTYVYAHQEEYVLHSSSLKGSDI